MLKFGFQFSDLYARAGLVRVDAEFLRYLDRSDALLAGQLAGARAQPAALAKKAESELLIALAPHLQDFIAALFDIEAEVLALSLRHADLAPLYSVKRQFVQRRAMHGIKPEEAAGLDGAALEARLLPGSGGRFRSWRSRARSAPGCCTRRSTASRSTRRCAMQPGPAIPRPDANGTAAACCSRRRPSSISRSWCTRMWTAPPATTCTRSRRRGCAGARASTLPTAAPISPARSIRRITASGATNRARTPAPPACARRPPEKRMRLRASLHPHSRRTASA